MNYFELYEKTKEVRKNLTVGSDWKILQRSVGVNGGNVVGRTIRIVRVRNQEVRYSYVDGFGYVDGFSTYGRAISTFKATCIPVIKDDVL